MPKNKTIILGAIGVLILIALWFVGYRFQPEKKEVPSSAQKEEAPIEIFSLAGVVSEVNGQDNFLKVKPSEKEKEFKVVLSKGVEIIRLKFPFDPKNPPKEASFTPEKIPIKIGDLKVGDSILIETTVNIYGKTEFDNVSRIQVLP